MRSPAIQGFPSHARSPAVQWKPRCDGAPGWAGAPSAGRGSPLSGCAIAINKIRAMQGRIALILGARREPAPSRLHCAASAGILGALPSAKATSSWQED